METKSELEARTNEWNTIIAGRNAILGHLQARPVGQRRLNHDELVTLARVIKACNARLTEVDPQVAEYYGIKAP